MGAIMAENSNPIMESNLFIILDKYKRVQKNADSYQSEAELEDELIQDLVSQGYEYLPELNTQEKMLANVRVQLQKLNDIEFCDDEWLRFTETYLDKPSDDVIDKTRKIHDDYIHDFVFNNGRIKNIYLVNKDTIACNSMQVIKQFEQTGTHANRYDVTLLVNGLPLVHIELKRRGVAIREAFNQIHRYSKESFNSNHSLFKYLQMFVISNGTDSRYFANTTQRNKNSFDFTINWAEADNKHIKDLKDLTATLFQKNTLLKVLLNYSVLDASDTLLVMRPYQIAATERILRKIKSSHSSKNWSTPESGGYIWHTTGSGKTLTSFKAAILATNLDFIAKVFFVVDRKDLDYQTMKEYQRFSPDSVNGSENTAGLKANLGKDDNKIIVTTIQKLNHLMKNEENLAIYEKQVVFIFDECHRSQFGEAQKNLKKNFKKFYQFGFTGTPIFSQNAPKSETTTTASVFGAELHSYVITDAIRDEKVLKFKVDYNNVRPRFKGNEAESNDEKIDKANASELFHPERIREISQYVLNNFHHKTRRQQGGSKGFNAMFAVSNIDAAKLYYECLNKLQQGCSKPLKVATIFSFVDNEEQPPKGQIPEESFNVSALDSSAKEFLSAAIKDYNKIFETSFGLDGNGFQNYYRDLSKRVKSKELDLVIVVGMFLTGFDAPMLNTLFVDRSLQYHGLIQAYSRTNRIYDATKTFGNIVTFRDLEDATIKAITLFGDSNTKNVILEKSYKEYMDGFSDIVTGKPNRGFITVLEELGQRFPDPENITEETDKKDFATLFGEYLRIENVLQNYDEFVSLIDLQHVDINNESEVEEFKKVHHLSNDDLAEMINIELLTERKGQDYRSTYNDIRDWIHQKKNSNDDNKLTLDWDSVVFEVELLKSQEIDLDYILEQIFENNKDLKDKATLIIDMRRMTQASISNRAKESLLVDFINQADLDKISNKDSMIKAFFTFARKMQSSEAETLIREEELASKAAKRYLTASIKREYASESGTDLNNILPKMSPLDPKYLENKQRVFQRISSFVDKFKGIGGEI